MIIAFTGAGISKPSGIDTFQEHPDIREKLTRHYATYHSDDYNKTIQILSESMKDKEPNDAHKVLAENNIPVITMNIDNLHELAGSSPLKLHGNLPSTEELKCAHTLFNKPVLYGDMAPNYYKAIQKVQSLQESDVLLVIGASRFTGIAVELREIAYQNGVRIVEIQENAQEEVRTRIELLKEQGYL